MFSTTCLILINSTNTVITALTLHACTRAIFSHACDSRSDETQVFGLQHFCARHLKTIITQLACHVQYTTWSTFHGTCREHLDFLLPTVPFKLDTICYSAVWSICRTIPFHKYKLRNAWPIAVSGGGSKSCWWWWKVAVEVVMLRVISV